MLHKTLCLFLRVCVCVCVWICLHTCRHGGVGGSRHHLCYILHNVILNQKSAMLCQYVCVWWLRNCVFVRVCVWRKTRVKRSQNVIHTFTNLPLCLCACVCARARVSLCVCVCVRECVYVFCVSRCLFVRIAKAQNDPCSLGNKPFHMRDLVHYMYHVTKSKLWSDHCLEKWLPIKNHSTKSGYFGINLILESCSQDIIKFCQIWSTLALRFLGGHPVFSIKCRETNFEWGW